MQSLRADDPQVAAGDQVPATVAHLVLRNDVDAGPDMEQAQRRLPPRLGSAISELQRAAKPSSAPLTRPDRLFDVVGTAIADLQGGIDDRNEVEQRKMLRELGEDRPRRGYTSAMSQLGSDTRFVSTSDVDAASLEMRTVARQAREDRKPLRQSRQLPATQKCSGEVREQRLQRQHPLDRPAPRGQLGDRAPNRMYTVGDLLVANSPGDRADLRRQDNLVHAPFCSREQELNPVVHRTDVLARQLLARNCRFGGV